MAEMTEDDPPCGCASCGTTKSKDGGPLLRCTRCKSSVYCSTTCQKNDWATHKKSCRPPYLHQSLAFLTAAIEAKAVTPDEARYLQLCLNRSVGQLHSYNLSNEALGGRSKEFHECTFATILMDALFVKDRGVLVDADADVGTSSSNCNPLTVGRIKGVSQPEGIQPLQSVAAMFQKKKTRKYTVQLLTDPNDKDSDNGEILTNVEPHRLRLLPITDHRHVFSVMCYFFDDSIPPHISDPDEYEFEGERLPAGVSWQYLNVCGETKWTAYPRGLAGRIESLYTCGSPHYLYRPGNPHCQGMCRADAIKGESVGKSTERFSTLVDATRQILFQSDLMTHEDEDEDGVSDNMTERDFFTGMKWRVRRLGPNASREIDDHRIQPMEVVSQPFIVDWTDDAPHCGLCKSKTGPFLTMECCGGTVCDTEDLYEMGSYERKGQCARNHRQQSICHYHHSEGHGSGDWQSCRRCVDDFHPYDYAVKATSFHVGNTNWRYNFDDNVRTDLHPADVAFPTCCECGVLVDTSEESTRTLSMRRNNGENKVRCSAHEGGFGRVKML